MFGTCKYRGILQLSDHDSTHWMAQLLSQKKIFPSSNVLFNWKQQSKNTKK
jgi:transposase